MRNPWQRDEPQRGRRRPDRFDRTSRGGSPYDFGAEESERVDPVDLLAIRADDELLDALAGGRPVASSLGAGLGSQLDSSQLDSSQLDAGYTDDQQMLAMLQAWRADVDGEPIPDLVSVEQASEAIVAGHRSARPRRRLMSVAAASAVLVLGLSGLGLGAGNAQPGDALWGVSTVLNGDRAKSIEASQRVDVALASAERALNEGRPADALQTLAKVTPDLNQVKDQQRKEALARKRENLASTAADTPEGESVRTDESGKRLKGDPGSSSRPSDAGKSGSVAGSGSNPGPGQPFGPGSPSPKPDSGGGGGPQDSTQPSAEKPPPASEKPPPPSEQPQPKPKPPPAQPPPAEQPKPKPPPAQPPPAEQPKPKPPPAQPPPAEQPKPKPRPKPSKGEGEGNADSGPGQHAPAGPHRPQPSS